MADSKKMKFVKDEEKNLLVILVDPSEKVLRYQIDMIENNDSIKLLTPQIVNKDNKIVLEYDLNNFSEVFVGLDKLENKLDFLFNKLHSINSVISNCERYLLFQDCLLLNKDYLFQSNIDKQLFLFYIPVKRKKKSVKVYKGLILDILKSFDYDVNEFKYIQKLTELLKRDDFSVKLFGEFLEENIKAFSDVEENIIKDETKDNRVKDIDSINNRANNEIKDKEDYNNKFESKSKKEISFNFNNNEEENSKDTKNNEEESNEKNTENIEEKKEENSKSKTKRRSKKIFTTENNLSKKVNKIKSDKDKTNYKEEKEENPTVSIKREYMPQTKKKKFRISIIPLIIGLVSQNIIIVLAIVLSNNQDFLNFVENNFIDKKLTTILLIIVISIILWSGLLIYNNLNKKNNLVMSKYDIWNIPNPGELDGLINDEKYKEELSDFVTLNFNDYYEFPYLETEYIGTYERIFITKPVFSIGNIFDESDYSIRFDGFSGLFFKILKNNNGYFIIDLSKDNDIFINGEKLISKDKILISDKDKIKFAGKEFTFNLG